MALPRQRRSLSERLRGLFGRGTRSRTRARRTVLYCDDIDETPQRHMMETNRQMSQALCSRSPHIYLQPGPSYEARDDYVEVGARREAKVPAAATNGPCGAAVTQDPRRRPAAAASSCLRQADVTGKAVAYTVEQPARPRSPLPSVSPLEVFYHTYVAPYDCRLDSKRDDDDAGYEGRGGELAQRKRALFGGGKQSFGKRPSKDNTIGSIESINTEEAVVEEEEEEGMAISEEFVSVDEGIMATKESLFRAGAKQRMETAQRALRDANFPFGEEKVESINCDPNQHINICEADVERHIPSGSKESVHNNGDVEFPKAEGEDLVETRRVDDYNIENAEGQDEDALVESEGHARVSSPTNVGGDASSSTDLLSVSVSHKDDSNGLKDDLPQFPAEGIQVNARINNASVDVKKTRDKIKVTGKYSQVVVLHGGRCEETDRGDARGTPDGLGGLDSATGEQTSDEAKLQDIVRSLGGHTAFNICGENVYINVGSKKTKIKACRKKKKSVSSYVAGPSEPLSAGPSGGKEGGLNGGKKKKRSCKSKKKKGKGGNKEDSAEQSESGISMNKCREGKEEHVQLEENYSQEADNLRNHKLGNNHVVSESEQNTGGRGSKNGTSFDSGEEQLQVTGHNSGSLNVVCDDAIANRENGVCNDTIASMENVVCDDAIANKENVVCSDAIASRENVVCSDAIASRENVVCDAITNRENVVCSDAIASRESSLGFQVETSADDAELNATASGGVSFDLSDSDCKFSDETPNGTTVGLELVPEVVEETAAASAGQPVGDGDIGADVELGWVYVTHADVPPRTEPDGPEAGEINLWASRSETDVHSAEIRCDGLVEGQASVVAAGGGYDETVRSTEDAEEGNDENVFCCKIGERCIAPVVVGTGFVEKVVDPGEDDGGDPLSPPRAAGCEEGVEGRESEEVSGQVAEVTPSNGTCRDGVAGSLEESVKAKDGEKVVAGSLEESVKAKDGEKGVDGSPKEIIRVKEGDQRDGSDGSDDSEAGDRTSEATNDVRAHLSSLSEIDGVRNVSSSGITANLDHSRSSAESHSAAAAAVVAAIAETEAGRATTIGEDIAEADSDEMLKMIDEAGFVDVFALKQTWVTENRSLKKLINKYRERSRRVARLQHLIAQLKRETAEMSGLVDQLGGHTTALRNEAADLRCTLSAVCDASVVGLAKETEARSLEPTCYRRYTNIRTPLDAANLLVAIRNRMKALGELEVLTYRKQLVLHHVLPGYTQERPPGAKRTTRPANKGQKPKKNEEPQDKKGHIVIEVVSPSQESGVATPSWSEDVTSTESPLTVSAPFSVSGDGETPPIYLPDTSDV